MEQNYKNEEKKRLNEIWMSMILPVTPLNKNCPAVQGHGYLISTPTHTRLIQHITLSVLQLHG